MYYIVKKYNNFEKNSKGILVPKKHNNFNDTIKFNGVYKFHSIKDGICKQIDEKQNLIMNDVFYRMVRAFLSYSFATYYNIGYCAIGTDNTTPTGTDTTLGTEVYRTPYVSLNNLTTSTVDATFYITTTDFSGVIEEVGIFCGTGASDTVDTGNLLSHVLWSYTKTTAEELLIEYKLTIS